MHLTMNATTFLAIPINGYSLDILRDGEPFNWTSISFEFYNKDGDLLNHYTMNDKIARIFPLMDGNKKIAEIILKWDGFSIAVDSVVILSANFADA